MGRRGIGPKRSQLKLVITAANQQYRTFSEPDQLAVADLKQG